MGDYGEATLMTIVDATPSGQTLRRFTLDSLTERVTAREIIRARIWQEVHDYNRECDGQFRGLVQPTEAERVLNGFAMKKHQPIDWDEQFRKACEGFEGNAFFMLVGERQAESLDEEFTVALDTEVQFVKLTPLVGG
jgi:hypothetical protein